MGRSASGNRASVSDVRTQLAACVWVRPYRGLVNDYPFYFTGGVKLPETDLWPIKYS